MKNMISLFKAVGCIILLFNIMIPVFRIFKCIDDLYFTLI